MIGGDGPTLGAASVGASPAVGACSFWSLEPGAACESQMSTSRSAFGGGGPVELAAGQEGDCVVAACSCMRKRSKSVGEGGIAGCAAKWDGGSDSFGG